MQGSIAIARLVRHINDDLSAGQRYAVGGVTWLLNSSWSGIRKSVQSLRAVYGWWEVSVVASRGVVCGLVPHLECPEIK